MDGLTFDKIVKARADQLTDNKIQECVNEVYRALAKLLNFNYVMQGGIVHDDAKKLLKILASDHSEQRWPKKLGERETKKVTEALLKTFDEFTQAKLAADKAEPLENKMEEDQPGKVKEVPADMPTRSRDQESGVIGGDEEEEGPF